MLACFVKTGYEEQKHQELEIKEAEGDIAGAAAVMLELQVFMFITITDTLLNNKT